MNTVISFPSSNLTVFVANSTPIVGYYTLGLYYLRYLVSKWVFPTFISPININLYILGIYSSYSIQIFRLKYFFKKFKFIYKNNFINKVIKL